MKVSRKILFSLSAFALMACVAGGYLYYCSTTSNPHNYAKMGDIPTPSGFQRINSNESGYAEYLRSLPLKGKGAKVQLYTGGESNYQMLSYAVVDMQNLSNAEQCADVCMRLRAEYLYKQGRYDDIHFQNVNGKTMRYNGGASRKNFESFLRRVYGEASTFSLSRELKQRHLPDMQPGDVFVYPAREGRQYGHAVMVVDVAENPKTGKKAFLLAEGNTPARNIHIMRNLGDPIHSPWFMLDEDEDKLQLAFFGFHADELRNF